MRYLNNFLGFIFLQSKIFHCVKFFNSSMNLVPILMYHGINGREKVENESSCLEMLGMSIPAAYLEEHLHFITKNYTVISLDDYISFRAKKSKLPRNPVIITFDDGFKNNYGIALRLLEKYKASATFFVIVNTLTDGDILLHRLYYALDEISYSRQKADLSGLIQGEHISKDSSRRDQLFAIRKNIHSGRENLDKTLKKVEDICSVHGDYDPAKYKSMYMSAEEIKDLIVKGFKVGGHSMTHESLASLGSDDKKKEIFESFEFLRGFVPSGQIHFAYPFGQKSDFDEETKHLLANAGYSSGLTTMNGLNRDSTDIFELRRIEVRSFSKYELALHVSGVVSLLKNMVKSLCRSKTVA